MFPTICHCPPGVIRLTVHPTHTEHPTDRCQFATPNEFVALHPPTAFPPSATVLNTPVPHFAENIICLLFHAEQFARYHYPFATNDLANRETSLNNRPPTYHKHP